MSINLKGKVILGYRSIPVTTNMFRYNSKRAAFNLFWKDSCE
jgi:hypothetical protein